MRRLISAEASAFTEQSWDESPESLHKKFYNDVMLSISRYETALERSLYKALYELQRVQGVRMGQAVIAPIAIDIHSEN